LSIRTMVLHHAFVKCTESGHSFLTLMDSALYV
jgi:hypothetical protein